MQGGHTDARLGGQERARVGHPRLRAGSGSRERTRQPLRERAVLTEVRREVVAGWAARHARAIGRDVPDEAAVQVGLVAEFERLDPRLPDPPLERARLAVRGGAAVGLEVDAHDQAGIQVGGDRVHDADPARCERDPHALWLGQAGDRVPRPVGAVPADPQLRRLIRREVADQLEEHRVGALGVGSGVRDDRAVLEREPEKPGLNHGAGGRVRDRDDGDVLGGGGRRRGVSGERDERRRRASRQGRDDGGEGEAW